MRINKKNKLKKQGFTLIELLVVIGILAILFSIIIIAVNPQENLQRANDVSTKAVASELIKTNFQYYATTKAFPWEKDANCQSELNLGGTLDTMPNCIHELTGGGKLEAELLETNDLKEIYLTKCGNTAILCYNPKSKLENQSAETRYTKFGVNNPGCPAASGISTECYWCKPVINDPSCKPDVLTTPTPLPATLPVPTLTPTPTVDLSIGPYKLDDTKLLKTYATFYFPLPDFGSYYDLEISILPDFSGGYPLTETYFNAPCMNRGDLTKTNAYGTSYRKYTDKIQCLASTPYNDTLYSQSCGKVIYWRPVDFYNHSVKGPTYSNTLDCTTKVGVLNMNDWWKYYSYINGYTNEVSPGEPYDASWDPNKDGKINWEDYVILMMQTKTRAGGWAPPE